MLTVRQQHRQFYKILNKYEARLSRNITIAKNKFIRSAAYEYRSHYGDVFHDEMNALTNELERILGKHYGAVVPKFGKLAISSMKNAPKWDTKEEVTLFGVVAKRWIAENALSKAKMIAKSTREDVRKVIDKGIDEGLGTYEIAKNITKVSLISRYRAEVISRTETHNAAIFGSMESARIGSEQTGIKLLKIWMPVLDERTRVSHADMESHPPIPMNEKFNVGGVMMDAPADPSAPAEQVINCRCAISYIEDERG